MMKPTKRLSIGLMLAIGLAVLIFGASVVRKDPGPGRELGVLLADPMASWQPSKAAGPEERIEERASKGLIKPSGGHLLRIIPLTSETAVLDEAIAAATNAGWELSDRQASAIVGSRPLVNLGSASITITIRRASDSSPATLSIGLRTN